ncbi:hypothetical protein Tsubulata_003861 [Turnera subulata]|uniref:tRNA/rRNA methyltransferase SpoU type domain-containing protein n=1 Tax=Turnera subulata TaxID=218843 RepID=A0A9Q0JIM3_9ROSI|nr:hypothetical protein Tsubulata_003861 [Turnera subulata]
MDTSRSLKALNAIAPSLSFHSWSRPSLFLPFCITRFKHQFCRPVSLRQRSSPLCSLSENGIGNCLPRGVGEGVSELSRNKLLQVVLVSPQIPGNTGCIARTCAASAVGLHLVGVEQFPVFIINSVSRYVVVKVHDSWAAFRDYFQQQRLTYHRHHHFSFSSFLFSILFLFPSPSHLFIFSPLPSPPLELPAALLLSNPPPPQSDQTATNSPLPLKLAAIAPNPLSLSRIAHTVPSVAPRRSHLPPVLPFLSSIPNRDGRPPFSLCNTSRCWIISAARVAAAEGKPTRPRSSARRRLYMVESDYSYRKGDYLIFGSETCGLPPEALLDCKSNKYGGGTIRIPMVETYVRCLNLSVSVGIALYEASRQLNYEQLQCPPESCVNGEQSFITEDVFA